MGATEFQHSALGPIEQAFDTAVKEAQYDYGHAGYTGTIAEKDGWVKIADRGIATSIAQASDWAEELLQADDRRITDKWGPAGAIEFDDPEAGGRGWFFFGWASC